MSSKHSFESPILQNISNEADTIVYNHLKDLNRISNDLKALEERLKLAGIHFTFSYVISSKQTRYVKPVSRILSPYEEYYDDVEFLECTDECLIWGKNESGEYRLRFGVYLTECEIERINKSDGSHLERERIVSAPKLGANKPVIEEKSHIRLRLEKELPYFYRKLLDALMSKIDQEHVFAYSPNYKGSIGSAKSDPDLMPSDPDLPF